MEGEKWRREARNRRELRPTPTQLKSDRHRLTDLRGTQVLGRTESHRPKAQDIGTWPAEQCTGKQRPTEKGRGERWEQRKEGGDEVA